MNVACKDCKTGKCNRAVSRTFGDGDPHINDLGQWLWECIACGNTWWK